MNLKNILYSVPLVVASVLPMNVDGQMIPKDKQLHLGAGAVIGGWSYTISPQKSGWKPVIYGMIGATVAGLGKETYDLLGGGNPEVKDLIATMVGGAVSVGLIKLCSIKRKPKLMTYGIIDDKGVQLKLVYRF